MKLSTQHILGAVAAGCLLAALIIVDARIRAQQLQADGIRFFREAVTAISGDWQARALLERGTSEIQEARIRQQLPAVFQSLAALGRLERLEEPTARPLAGEGTLAAAPPSHLILEAPARFSAARGTVHMTLRREAAGWKILAFAIDSPLFARHAAAPPPPPPPLLPFAPPP